MLLRTSKEANELGGKRRAEAAGASRPKTEGPMRMPPTISPMTLVPAKLAGDQAAEQGGEEYGCHLDKQEGHCGSGEFWAGLILTNERRVRAGSSLTRGESGVRIGRGRTGGNDGSGAFEDAGLAFHPLEHLFGWELSGQSTANRAWR